MQQQLRQIPRIEQASLLEMPDDEFQRLVVEIEHGSLFQKLYRKEELIRYQRFPRTHISSSSYQRKEEIVAARVFSETIRLQVSGDGVTRHGVKTKWRLQGYTVSL